jgi:hypothetical protein
MTRIFNLFISILFVAAMGSMSSCKKTFDAPPGASDLPIVANTTIASLKALHTVPGQMDIVADDIIISGIVTANDSTGNFYKELYIEDSTGAIHLKLEQTSLYLTYPVGRRVYVYCKHLWLSDDNNLMMLGSRAVVNGVPSLQGILGSEIDKYVKAGSIGNPVVPTVVTLSQLGTNMQNPYIGRLIKLEGFEFTPRDTLKTFSDTSVYKSDQNDTIQNCAGEKTIIRTSAYANFAAVPVPKGKGDLTAIYTVFRTTKQFIVRSTADVAFNNPRCGALPPGWFYLLNENFEAYPASSTAPYISVNIPGWQNVSELGIYNYTNRTFSSNKYAYTSPFGTNLPAISTWLVTKGVNLDATTEEILTFDTKQDYRMSNYTGTGTDVASTMKVMYSTNYTGTGDPFAAGVTWSEFTSYALSPGTTSGSPFPANYTNSGNIDLSSLSGTVYIAFKNEGADPAGTTSDKTSAWEIDNIAISGH